MRFNERLRLAFCAILISVMIVFSFACGGESGSGGNGENGGEPTTYSILGQITTNGIGLIGVTMTLSGTSIGTATTDSNGNYSFASLSNGSYAVTPSLSGYSFDPVYRNVNISGANETAADFIAVSIRLEKPNTNNVYGEIILPDQSPIDLSSLKVQSFLTNVNVSSSGYFNDLQVIDEGGGQIVFVLDGGNNPIMVAYISTESVANGTLNIGVREMALGLIAFNPYLMILSQDQRASILDQAELHADFNGLMGSIEMALIQSPDNALDYDTNPHIYQDAMIIGLEILESYGDNPTATYGSYRILSTVGQEDDPHIDDPAGPNVTFVNPKMTFYGIQFEPPIDAVDDILLRGKGTWIDLGWPPFVRTPPHEQNFNLGDGTFTLTFYKGFNTSTSGWLDPWTAPGKATYANFLKILAIGLDVLGAQWYVDLNDTTIFLLLSAVDPPSLYFDASIGDALKTGNWLKMLRDTLEYLIDHWDDIARWVYQDWPGDETALALQSALRVVNGVANAIPIAKILILGTKAINEYIPFGFDLVMAPPILEYNVKQTNGVLSEISSLVPPTAVFTFNPLQPNVGETVNFDASDSYDDADPQYSLQVRWDFDGNGSWDTTWSSTKTATYSFSNRGTFRSVLQVKDTNNQIGITSHDIYIVLSEKILFVSTRNEDADIYMMDPDGSNQMNLTNHPSHDYDPEWSPDGNRIVFVSERDGTADIYTMNLDGSDLIRLTYPVNPSDPGDGRNIDRSPHWSPDGSEIVFNSLRDNFNDIWLMNADGSTQRKLNLPFGAHAYPKWSPDGNKIVFASMLAGEGHFDIYKVNRDGTDLQRLSNDPSVDVMPCFNFNGDKIAFVSTRDNNYDIWIMNADGSDKVNLTSLEAFGLYFPSWSPEGEKITYASGYNFDYNGIWIMNSDGSNKIRILSDNSTNPAWSPRR